MEIVYQSPCFPLNRFLPAARPAEALVCWIALQKPHFPTVLRKQAKKTGCCSISLLPAAMPTDTLVCWLVLQKPPFHNVLDKKKSFLNQFSPFSAVCWCPGLLNCFTEAALSYCVGQTIKQNPCFQLNQAHFWNETCWHPGVLNFTFKLPFPTIFYKQTNKYLFPFGFRLLPAMQPVEVLMCWIAVK